MTIQAKENLEPMHEDSVRILATKIKSANAVDEDQFTYSTQIDIEPYARAMQGLNTSEWAKAMEEELDQLQKTTPGSSSVKAT